MAKPSDMISIKLRMKESLRRQIEAEAKKAKRSANQEMVRRLEQSLAEPDAIKEEIRAAVRAIINQDLREGRASDDSEAE